MDQKLQTLLEKTFYCVEANSNETLDVYRVLVKEHGEQWNKDTNCFFHNVGNILGLPFLAVNITLTFIEIRGKTICFYEDTSRFVDHEMIENWIKKHTPNSKGFTDGMNWTNFWYAIQQDQVLWFKVEGYSDFVQCEDLEDLGKQLNQLGGVSVFRPNNGQVQRPYLLKGAKVIDLFWGPKDKPEKESEISARELKLLYPMLGYHYHRTKRIETTT